MTEDSGVLPSADDADELEQTRDAVPPGSDEGVPHDRPWDANEADLMEQKRSLPITDEDESPDGE